VLRHAVGIESTRRAHHPAAGDSRRREELATHRRLQWVKDTTILTNLRRSPVNRRLFIAGTAVVALVVVAVLLATALGGGGGGGY
jgi:hypothetical protein